MPLLWRAMTEVDIPAVVAIAEQVYPGYPEDQTVLAERLLLHPAGCHVLAGPAGRLAGYVLSHPWRYMDPPALNTLLGELPDKPTTYHLHDIALLPSARGGGYANGMARTIIYEARAEGFPSVSLVAVNNSQPFWTKHGFRVVAAPALDEKLRSYDAHARLMARTF